MSTFSQTTGISIQSAFEKYNSMNPTVFQLIVREAEKAVARKKKFSVKQIVGYLRWEVYLETTLFDFDTKVEISKYRIPDQFTSRYSRLLIERYPYMKDFVEQRSIRSL